LNAFLVFVYHCFDRIVIQGYLPLLTRPEHIVHFFRDVHGQYPITPQVLAKATLEYRGWVEGYARNHKIPLWKAEKGMRKEDLVRPYLQRMERRGQHGVYCLFTSMEMGSTFTSKMPKFPTDDPDYRIIRRVPSRFLHYYFYIRDPVIGPLAMCVATYLPLQTTYYLNGHNFLEIELRRQQVSFRKDDNAFLATADPKALQKAADRRSADITEKRWNYWSWLLCPKFSEKDRKAVNLRRDYSINQIEYCRNFVFKRHFPITDDGLYAPGLRFGEQRVMAILAALVGFCFLIRGFTNRQLVDRVRGLLQSPYTSRQATYDLRRLRRKGLIAKIAGTQRYQLASLGRRVAVLFTKTYGRVLAPGLSLLDPRLLDDVGARSCLNRAWQGLERNLDEFIQANLVGART
jgi:hypothetical protein